MDRYPYITQPPWAKWLQRSLYTLRYLCTGAAGWMAVYVTEVTSLHVAGWVMMGASVLALVGVATRYFHVELSALWFLCAGLVLAVYAIFGEGAWTTGTLVGALLPDLAARLLSLSLIARRARSAGANEGGQ